MRIITSATLSALIAAAPAAAIAQAIKDAPTIEQQLMPSIGQPLGSGTRGLGLARRPQGTATPPSEPAAGPTSQPPSAPVATTPGPAVRPTAHPAARPVAAPPAAAAPSGVAATDLTVLFANGSAELAPEGVAQLNQLALALTGEALSGYRFRIEGYTDTVGSTPYNMDLSERRAASVVEYLVSNGHVGRDRLQSVGFGKTRLMVPTPDQTPEPRNRRVRVVNVGT